MKPIHTFTVTPKLPASLRCLPELAQNLRWAWNQDTIALFRRLDRDLWEVTGHNPVRMLGAIDETQLEAAAADPGFISHLERVRRDLDSYEADNSTWFGRVHGNASTPLIAYFSAEFGLTECLSIFAGGLGLLAGDHLKSASDLGVPLVGVGLLYQQGYFRQYLNEGGWQQEAYEDNDFHSLPLSLERRTDGSPVTVEIPYPGRQVVAQVWRAQVGRIALYLLDTNIASNERPEDRDLTDQLYGGDLEMRIKQEIMLGIGGYQALKALGLEPIIYHMNEGHSAFLALERIRRLMISHSLSFAEAREAASASLVFTTHTPVEAGHDYFPPDLVDRYFRDYAQSLDLSRQDFLALGRRNQADDNEPFCMTVLALRLASHSNGVSRLHGQVTRRMWQVLWPDVPEDEIPITHVTNGVHFPSWISYEMDQLYERYLGSRWKEVPSDERVWQGIDRVPAEELWRTHERRRERLVTFVRRLRAQLEARGAPEAEVEAAGETLDLEALTIGFARRFAPYKRAALLLRDPDRLARLLNNPERPVQIVFSGKAHPRNEAGKQLIRQVVALSREERFRGRLVFVEDYDMAVARYLVQGADVWLNTPRRLFEASGTSGMKAAANGALNLSILDGWWDEAWEQARGRQEPIGWAIGRGERYDDPDLQDQVEAEVLYDLLERDVVPSFYDRGVDGLPRRWIARVKASIGTLCHFFNSYRMVREYTERFYLPAAERYHELTAVEMARSKELAAWRKRVLDNWAQLRVEEVGGDPPEEVEVGSGVRVKARVYLGALTPEGVAVELYLGRINADGNIVEPEATRLEPVAADAEGHFIFEGTAVPCGKSGLHGYTLRVLPRHPDLGTPFLPGLIVWAKPSPKA